MAPNLHTDTNNTRNSLILCLVLLLVMVLPQLALAQTADFQDTGKKVCGFFSNINSILNLASITVVTVAVVFSGYQIAFAHKRIADVAPVLIGGVLIGAASQLAKMLVGTDAGQSSSCSASSTMLLQFLSDYYA
jgi:type IV secretion system protein VirB2